MPETPCRCPPRAPEIPAGLDSLPRQRITFAGVRAAVLRAARSAPALAGWRADDGDIGLLLAEGWSYVADVLGLYDRVIADEMYLQTARRERALTRLLGLLGFRARPGSGASAAVSLSASGATTISVPTAGFRSEPIDGESPQIFESGTTTPIHPATNGWAIAPVRPSTIDSISARLLLEPENGIGLATGGLVLFRWPSGSGERLDAARVLSVNAVRESTGRTLIEIRVAPQPPFTASVALDEIDVLVPSNVASPTERKPAADGAEPVLLVAGSIGGFILDAVYRALKRGQGVIVEREPSQSGTVSLLAGRRISLVKEGTDDSAVVVAAGDDTLTPPTPDVVAPVTRIEFTDHISFQSGPEETTPSLYTIHYGMVRAGRIVRGAKTSITQGDFSADGVALDGINALPPEPHRKGTFFLVGADGGAVRVQGEVVADDVPGRLRFVLAEGQTFPSSLRAPVTIRGNLVEVTRGETVANEMLGSGDAGRAFLSFKLARADLTYLPDDKGPGRLKSTLQVRVNGILWKEVDSFFGRGPEEEIYIVRNDIEDRRAVVTFGDGIRGRRPPTGTNNIIATYRSGVGATRPPANAINSIASAIKGVLTVTNPLPAEGGSDPDSPTKLRTSAPREALLLGRLVSVQDFQARMEMEPGVIAARTEWVWDDDEQRALVRIEYVGAPTLANLESSIRLSAEPGVGFRLVAAKARAAKLGIDVLVDTRFVESDVVQSVKAALLDAENGLLAPAHVGIGATLYRSRVFERIVAIPGVVSVTRISLFIAGSAVDMFTACGGAAPGHGAYFAFDEGNIVVSSVEATDAVHACGP
jgi:predicted phage baseplate assembly protein